MIDESNDRSLRNAERAWQAERLMALLGKEE